MFLQRNLLGRAWHGAHFIHASSKRPLSTAMQSTPLVLSKDAQQALEKTGQRTLMDRFLNIVMKNGNKRAVVEQEMRYGLLVLYQKTQQPPERLFEQAIHRLTPVVTCGSYRRGAKAIRVPLAITPYRGQSMAMRWIRDVMRKRAHRPRGVELPLGERWALEVLSVLEGKSALLQKRSQMHREALLHRSFVHLRWSIGYPPSS